MNEAAPTEGGRRWSLPTIERSELPGLRARRWLIAKGGRCWPWLMAAIGTVVAMALYLGIERGLEVLQEMAGEDPRLKPLATEAETTTGLIAANLFTYWEFLQLGLSLSLGALLAAILLWRRPLRLMSYGAPFRWSEVLKGGGAWLVASLVGSLVSILIAPSGFRWVPLAQSFALWFLLGIAVIGIQTLGEELFLRGYLLRLWGGALGSAWLAVPPLVVLFISQHLSNNDVKVDPAASIVWFAISEVVSYIVLFRTGSLAAAWGIHWANNVVVFLLLSTLPGGVTTMVFATFTEPTLAAGKSQLTSPSSWLELAINYTVFFTLILWRRSPFYLARKVQQPAQTEEPTAAPRLP